MTTTEATVEQVNDTDLLVVREFDAPRELVWEAMSTPEHMRRWYGCDETPLIECRNDVRVGGTYFNKTQMPDGSTFSFSGEYLEVDPPARVVFIERFDPMPGAESRVTSTLDDLGGGRCRLTVLISFVTKDVADAALATGMSGGMLESYDRLEQVARSLA